VKQIPLLRVHAFVFTSALLMGLCCVLCLWWLQSLQSESLDVDILKAEVELCKAEARRVSGKTDGLTVSNDQIEIDISQVNNRVCTAERWFWRRRCRATGMDNGYVVHVGVGK